MKTWNDYKQHVKAVDPAMGQDIEEIEALSAIVSSIIQRRSELGISQRTLAAKCNIPQSSVARIESLRTTPKLDTLLKLMHPLGLTLQAVPA